jgi:hypothetical protein
VTAIAPDGISPDPKSTTRPGAQVTERTTTTVRYEVRCPQHGCGLVHANPDRQAAIDTATACPHTLPDESGEA